MISICVIAKKGPGPYESVLELDRDKLVDDRVVVELVLVVADEAVEIEVVVRFPETTSAGVTSPESML